MIYDGFDPLVNWENQCQVMTVGGKATSQLGKNQLGKFGFDPVIGNDQGRSPFEWVNQLQLTRGKTLN